MERHTLRSRLSRRRYAVLAASVVLGVSAILAVAAVPSILARPKAPVTTALAGAEAHPSARSSGRTIYACARPGGGFYSVSITATRSCRSGAHRVSWRVRQTQPVPPRTATGAPADTPADTSTSSPSGSGPYFGLAPLGTPLPRSDAYCASHVQPMAENVRANTTANHDIPPAGTDFHWGPWTRQSPGEAAYFAHVDGDFAGTTGEILEWAACKWGWDQDYAFAEAVRESSWVQSTAGDSTYGILQIMASKHDESPTLENGFGGYPWTQNSTALNADAQMAFLRSCYDGDDTWLGPSYHAGDAWGCIGSWYSGQWYSAAADGYISRVQAALNSQAWLKP
jgi:hypothetical protein